MTTSLDAREQSRGTRPGLVEGRVALVTGGTRGIGAAICHELAGQGAHVAAGFWHDHEAAEKFLADVSAEHPDQRVTIHEGNIGHADACRRVLHEVIDQQGQVDILVNNAGITIDRTVAKMTDEDWQKVIAVNLSGAFFMAAAAVEHMLHELLDQISREEQSLNLEKIRGRIAASIACHAAIKINMPLEQNKMEWLLAELAKTDHPMSCPHGRPVVLRYSVKDIQKAFKRI